MTSHKSPDPSKRVNSVLKGAGYATGGVIADGGTYGRNAPGSGSPVSTAGSLKKAKERPGGEAEGKAAPARLDKFARGGRTKGNTTINIVVPVGKPEPDGDEDKAALLAAALAAKGAPRPAPAPPAPPMGMMPGGGGAPMGMPQMFKKGGAVRSPKDMTAGAGSGEGRLQKSEMQARVNKVLGR